MTTSFRASLRSGIKDILDTYQAANPTLLAHVYDHPPSAPRTPCAYIEKPMAEKVEHTAQVRIRRPTATVVVLNKLSSNEQATDEQDALVDGLLDAFTADPGAAGGSTLLEPVAVDDVEITVGDAIYAGFRISIAGLIQEGRA
jgi:hypothetical protein